ncbi:hypothetical protein CERSUDRAFT_162969 [Gelatoporia subvermispora B]|uniref:Enoyl reductase (ER) domain-containing protein n=1 Tax=Ceriporiopsis subvermispora (strain B) TaxID=914234 RepID=M2QHI9_CERS8|nr:hypothetical protein CERSUDRAFT_162969 [Gelatoporia subvermispora B]
METQKALLLPSKQGEWVIGTVAVAKPGPGQLLVKIEATALNPADWKIQVYGVLFETFPVILGSDAAGIVIELGEGVQGFAVGDRVFFQGYFVDSARSTYQQYALSNADVTAKIPKNISVEQAATIPACIATPALGLFDRCHEDSAKLFPPWEDGGQGKYIGKPIVIFGGATSVGQYAIQLVRLAGFGPIITTASLKNTTLLNELGATHVLDRDLPPEALLAQIAALANAPIEIVFDAVSLPQTQNAAFDILTPEGQVIIVTQDAIDQEKKRLAPRKRAVVVLGNVSAPGREQTGRGLYAKLTELVGSGAIKPNRVELLANGLAGIPYGLKRMQEDRVSAVKLVVRPHETP